MEITKEQILIAAMPQLHAPPVLERTQYPAAGQGADAELAGGHRNRSGAILTAAVPGLLWRVAPGVFNE